MSTKWKAFGAVVAVALALVGGYFIGYARCEHAVEVTWHRTFDPAPQLPEPQPATSHQANYLSAVAMTPAQYEAHIYKINQRNAGNLMIQSVQLEAVGRTAEAEQVRETAKWLRGEDKAYLEGKR